MAKTCYLHFGMPKTGTTSIQHSLHRFENDKIVYAKFAETHHSTGLQILFSESGLPYHQPTHGVIDIKRRSEILKQRYKKRLNVAVSGDRDMILSSELIIDRLTTAELTTLRDYLAQHFDQIRAIAYIRPFQSSAASGWQQRIKSGSFDFNVGTTRYQKRIEPFFSLFGRENVQLVPFVRSQLIGGDVVIDFMTRVGIDPLTVTPAVKNEAQSLEGISQIFMYNCFGCLNSDPLKKKKRRFALALDLQGFGTNRIGFTKSLMDAAVLCSGRDLAWISKEVGQDMIGTFVEVEEPLRDIDHLMQIAYRSRDAAAAHLMRLRDSGKSRLVELDEQELAAKPPVKVVGPPRSRIRRLIRKFTGAKLRQTGKILGVK